MATTQTTASAHERMVAGMLVVRLYNAEERGCGQLLRQFVSKIPFMLAARHGMTELLLPTKQ